MKVKLNVNKVITAKKITERGDNAREYRVVLTENTVGYFEIVTHVVDVAVENCDEYIREYKPVSHGFFKSNDALKWLNKNRFKVSNADYNYLCN